MVVFSHPQKNLEQFDIAPGQKIADFGSGVGYHTFIAAKAAGPSGHVYALDIQKDLLITLRREAQKSHLYNVEIISADLEKPGGSKLKENVIDRGIIANVLFQIHEKQNFVREVARVMKTGGLVLVIDWADSFGGMGPPKNDVIGKEDCQILFQENGFALEKSISAGLHHYGFVFKKV